MMKDTELYKLYFDQEHQQFILKPRSTSLVQKLIKWMSDDSRFDELSIKLLSTMKWLPISSSGCMKVLGDDVSGAIIRSYLPELPYQFCLLSLPQLYESR